jgi:ABC-type transport system involved in multi-copper enzyme maturation permease subunit
MASLTHGLGNLFSWVFVGISTLFLGSAIIYSNSYTDPPWLAGDGVAVYAAVYVSLSVILFVAMLLMIGASLAFGWDGPMASLFAASSAESIPPGDATLIQLRPFRETSLRKMGHSRLYRDERVIRIILRKIGVGAAD